MKKTLITFLLLLCTICFSGSINAQQPIYIPDLSDEELVAYLLDNVEKAREMVHSYGMATLVTGENEDLIGVGPCRLVFLGTSHDEHFVLEFHYAISEHGEIYEYDPVDDLWNFSNDN